MVTLPDVVCWLHVLVMLACAASVWPECQGLRYGLDGGLDLVVLRHFPLEQAKARGPAERPLKVVHQCPVQQPSHITAICHSMLHLHHPKNRSVSKLCATVLTSFDEHQRRQMKSAPMCMPAHYMRSSLRHPCHTQRLPKCLTWRELLTVLLQLQR